MRDQVIGGYYDAGDFIKASPATTQSKPMEYLRYKLDHVGYSESEFDSSLIDEFSFELPAAEDAAEGRDSDVGAYVEVHYCAWSSDIPEIA